MIDLGDMIVDALTCHHSSWNAGRTLVKFQLWQARQYLRRKNCKPARSRRARRSKIYRTDLPMNNSDYHPDGFCPYLIVWKSKNMIQYLRMEWSLRGTRSTMPGKLASLEIPSPVSSNSEAFEGFMDWHIKPRFIRTSRYPSWIGPGINLKVLLTRPHI